MPTQVCQRAFIVDPLVTCSQRQSCGADRNSTPQQGCMADTVPAAPARSACATASRSSWRACTWTLACTCTSLAATARRTCWTARRRRLPRSPPPVPPRLPSQAALTCALRQAGPWTRMLHWHQVQAAEQRTKQKSSVSQSSGMPQAPTRQRQRCQRPSSIREAAGPWRGKLALAPRGPMAARDGLGGRREPCAMAALRGRARTQRLARATGHTGWAMPTRVLTGLAWTHLQLCVCVKSSHFVLSSHIYTTMLMRRRAAICYTMLTRPFVYFCHPGQAGALALYFVACGECWRGRYCGRLLFAMLTCGPLRAGQPCCRCRAARHRSC
jgi:hypothetical protein